MRDGFIEVRGAREHNLKNVDLDIPRDALVVFTGVSGSGKSSLAFGTLFAEAQRRYLDSVAPYVRRLLDQAGAPAVDSIVGLPPAVALQQQRGGATSRSSVGTITSISDLLRLLYSRAGDYPAGQTLLYAESFSPNTPEGACPKCHGLGREYDVTEASMVPDPSLTIRERAIAAWPPAWHGQNLRDILVTLGYDVDIPWKKLSRRDRNWILFSDEQPVVPVYAGFTSAEVKRAIKRKDEPSYMGTFTSARRYVLHAFATTQSALIRRRVSKYLVSNLCPLCDGKRLNRAALSVRVAGLDIAELSTLSLAALAETLAPFTREPEPLSVEQRAHPERVLVQQRIAQDLAGRIETLTALGLGYLSLDRSTPTLSPGEIQRLRLAAQVHGNLFGVVYVLDEPSAGLHPADTRALLNLLQQLKAAGNSVFVVEHEIDVIRQADWIVDVGPFAGSNGGQILYSGPLAGLQHARGSRTAPFVFNAQAGSERTVREPKAWLELEGVSRNNIRNLSVRFPLGILTAITGVSGSGKSSLASQALTDILRDHLGDEPEADAIATAEGDEPSSTFEVSTEGHIVSGTQHIQRVVQVDQKPIGRTPRSNLATYTGLFDAVRKLFAQTKTAKSRRYGAGRFSFNVAAGRCDTCEGEGFVSVELLFLPSVYAPCQACGGSRYNDATLQVRYNDRNIADVLAMTVDEACSFFESETSVFRPLNVLQQVGLGYLRLGQPATELSGGEAQRIKLATELQRARRGNTLYVLDEPTTGLHPSDVDRLMSQLHELVDAGSSIIVVEHDLRVIANSDWIIDIGPGAGLAGGRVVVEGPPRVVAKSKESVTASYLREYLNGAVSAAPTNAAGYRSPADQSRAEAPD
ncbi:MAG: excinuclease ABC subunit A [Gemmatimonas sp.]